MVVLIVPRMMNSGILAMNINEHVESRRGGRARWPPFHWLESPEIKPIVEHFWRARYDEDDLAMYNRFIEILRLARSGFSGGSIGRTLQINNVRKYLTGRKKSFLTHLRGEHDRVGFPEPNHQWLPLHLKPRGTPDTSWIQVPSPVHDISDVSHLIAQLRPASVASDLIKGFGFKSESDLISERINLFGFLLGAAVGDASKPLKGTSRFPSRTISMILSKNKPNGLRFGEFTSLCMNVSLGLAMHRIRDAPSSDGRFTNAECYRWLSPASPLIAWIFHECLGLNDRETTTYNTLRMDWLLSTPEDFRILFLQGVAESDGWPDAGADVVRVVASPNTELFRKLLESLGCKPKVYEQPPVQVIQCTTEEAMTLPLFSPRIASSLYLDMRTLAQARRFPHRIALPNQTVQIIKELSKSASSTNEVCLKLAQKTGYKVSSETVRKYTPR